MSLYDIFMQRAELEHQNALASDNTGIVLQALAQGVANGIQEEQKRKQQELDAKRQTDNAIKMYSAFSGSKEVPSISPSITIGSDGTAKTVIKTLSPTEIKSKIDIERADKKAKAIDGYINGDISDVELLRNMGTLGISDSEFDIANQARKRINTSNIESKINSDIQVEKLNKPVESIGRFKVPEGFRISGYEHDKFGNIVPKGIEPIPASEIKAQAELEDAKKKDTLKSEMVKSSAKDTLETIAQIKNGIGNFGIFGGVPSIPGTDRANWEANINKLLSKRIVDLMTEMKNASKTGATGFGQLSEKELKVLQDASTALKRTLSPSDALRYLTQMEDMANKVISGNNPMQEDISKMSDEELKKIIGGM